MSAPRARGAGSERHRSVLGRMRVRLGCWIGVAAALALVLGMTPLFGVLGFELALWTAVLGAIMGLDVGAALARVLQRMPVTLARAEFPARTVVRSTLTASGVALAIVAIPAVISAVRGIWSPTCDWWFGVVAYGALPLVTTALAAALGHALALLVKPRRVLGAMLAQLPLIALALAGLYRFYAAPPVFTYNPIIGYFPGNLYDENVQLGSALAWARLEQLLWVVAIVAAVVIRFDVPRFRVVWRAPRPAGRRLGALAVALGCATGATVLHLNAGALGYAIDAEDIEVELAGRLETAHFIIHYARTKEIEAEMPLIAADHEFRYAQVVAQLGAAPADKLVSFYFASREQKGRWMGARDVEMAKPWRREIYIDHRAFPHASLRHEIAHAVASEFGDPVFGVAARRVLGFPALINPGLIEGLAVAADWPAGYDRPTPHESVRAMQAMGMVPTIDELLSLRFLTVSSARGYTTAGSFLRFLLDRYGPAPLRAVYGSGGDFATAYGKPQETLEAEWRAMIATIELPPTSVEASRERFRAGSVFARPCPHAIAARRERAREVYAHGDRPHAVTLMRRVCKDAPEEPRHLMELGDFLVSGSLDERAEAEALWTALASDVERATSSIRVEAYERLANVAAFRGDVAGVRTLIAEASKLPVDGSARRQLEAKTFALAHEGPAGAALRGYFFGTTPGFDALRWAQFATLTEPGLGLGYYLLGLQYANAGDWAMSAAALDRGLELGLPGLLFVKNAARRLAIAAYRANDVVRVGKAIAHLTGSGMGAADRWLAKDWQDRLIFAVTPPPPALTSR